MLGLPAPVAVVALERERLARRLVDHREGPGAGALDVDLLALVGLRRQDPGVRAGHPQRQQHVRRRRGDRHGGIVDGLHRGRDVGVERTSRYLGVQDMLQCADHRFRVHRRSVLELDAVAQRELPRFRLDLLPGRGEVLRERAVRLVLEEGLQTAGPRERDAVVGLRRPGGTVARTGRRRRCCRPPTRPPRGPTGVGVVASHAAGSDGEGDQCDPTCPAKSSHLSVLLCCCARVTQRRCVPDHHVGLYVVNNLQLTIRREEVTVGDMSETSGQPWTPPGGAFWGGSWRPPGVRLEVRDPEDGNLGRNSLGLLRGRRRRGRAGGGSDCPRRGRLAALAAARGVDPGRGSPVGAQRALREPDLPRRLQARARRRSARL